jgi:hypothetical protein
VTTITSCRGSVDRLPPDDGRSQFDSVFWIQFIWMFINSMDLLHARSFRCIFFSFLVFSLSRGWMYVCVCWVWVGEGLKIKSTQFFPEKVTPLRGLLTFFSRCPLELEIIRLA